MPVKRTQTWQDNFFSTKMLREDLKCVSVIVQIKLPELQVASDLVWVRHLTSLWCNRRARYLDQECSIEHVQ